MSATTDRPPFPHGFFDLEPFDAWALASEGERSCRRRTSELTDLQQFYDHMLPRMPDVLSYLDDCRLDALTEEQQRLLDLSLAFAEIAPFVEQYKRVILPEIFDEVRFVPIHEAAGPVR